LDDLTKYLRQRIKEIHEGFESPTLTTDKALTLNGQLKELVRLAKLDRLQVDIVVEINPMDSQKPNET